MSKNENTSLRATVYNGYSSMRVMRYYTAKMRGEKNAPLPNDSGSTPDQVISYRKTLVLGEKLKIELLNIPDTSQAGSTPITARLSLQDEFGKTIYLSPPQSFSGQEMEARTIVLPSENFAEQSVLRPRLEIENNNRTQTFGDGLHYIDLRATWNWDYKWVKQSLRDLLQPTQTNFTVSTPGANGERMVSASFAANEPLQHVEVLDNDDVVYSYAANDLWRENDEQVIIRLSWGALSTARINGSIALQNATARWLLPQHEFQMPIFEGQTLAFKNLRADKRRRRVLLAVPRSQLEKAVLNFALPAYFRTQFLCGNCRRKISTAFPAPMD